MDRTHCEQYERVKREIIEQALNDAHEYLMRTYSYDISRIVFDVKNLDDRIPEGYDSIPNHIVTFFEGDTRLLSFKFTRIRKDFADTLWGPNTDYLSYGVAKIISDLEISSTLSDHELKTLTHAICLVFLFYGMLLFEEDTFNHLPPTFQETWMMMWGRAKLVEYEGVSYVRFDDPCGWNG